MSSSVPEIYLIELYNQCKFAIQAYAAADSALDRFGQGPADTFGELRRHQREVFRNLHSLLHHAGNVSSLLWPEPGADESVRRRGEGLREVVGPLRRIAVLRDLQTRPGTGDLGERLSGWVDSRDPDRVLLDHVVPSGEGRHRLRAERRIRTYDPATGELTLWDETVPVRDLTDALRRLCRQVETVLGDAETLRSRH